MINTMKSNIHERHIPYTKWKDKHDIIRLIGHDILS